MSGATWADGVAKECEARKISVGRVTQKAVIEVYSTLKIKSPVDTGRFRNNWMYGVDSVPTGTLGVTGGAPVPPVGPDAHLHRHYIVNNLPYAHALEGGHSKQAPNGMVALTVIEWPSIVARAVASERK